MAFKTGVLRNHPTLFPEMIEDYIPDNHLAKTVIIIVETLSLQKITGKYSELGRYAISPKILVAILFYGYARGIRSSRKLSQACVERLDFMYITAKLRPSHKTISEFRRTNLKELKELFKEIILIGIKIGLAKIGNIKVSIDGSKIRANASGKLSKDEEGLNKLLEEVKEQVAKIMKEAEDVDKKEDKEYGNNRGDELPEGLDSLQGRKTKIEEALKELQEEKKQLRENILKGKEKLTKKEEEEIERKKINMGKWGQRPIFRRKNRALSPFSLGFRQFLLRGIDKVKGEFNLMCVAHNLQKIWKYCTANKIDLELCLTS